MSILWTEEQIVERLKHIHDRIAWIADQEARSAWVKGWAADGHLDPERQRLIEEADTILEKLTRPFDK